MSDQCHGRLVVGEADSYAQNVPSSNPDMKLLMRECGLWKTAVTMDC